MGFLKKLLGVVEEDALENDDIAAGSSEIETLRQKVHEARMPPGVESIALREVEKLTKTDSSAAEYMIGINYIEYLSSLPWNTQTEDNLDIQHAKEILDNEHYGLADIKERILEYLAVRTMKLSYSHKLLVVDDDENARRNMEPMTTSHPKSLHMDSVGPGLLI